MVLAEAQMIGGHSACGASRSLLWNLLGLPLYAMGSCSDENLFRGSASGLPVGGTVQCSGNKILLGHMGSSRKEAF